MGQSPDGSFRMARTSSWRPTPEQRLLLEAALGRGEDVASSFAAWTRITDGAPIDAASTRLLPLLEDNLRAHRIDDERMLSWQAGRAQTWLDNRNLFHEAAGVLAAFDAAGIDTRVLKGAALAVVAYRDESLRPMSDVDLLVPEIAVHDAMRILNDAGWTPDFAPAEALVPYQHSVGFSNNRGGRCDLHWRLLADGRQRLGDADYWRSPLIFDLAGRTVAALSPSDQLLHVCVHGALWNQTPTLRWVADAATLLRAFAGVIDWALLARRIHERGLAAPVQTTLTYLDQVIHGLVPANGLELIRSVDAPGIERLVHRCRQSPIKALRAVGRLQYWLRRWRASSEPLTRRAAAFRAYLQVRPQGRP